MKTASLIGYNPTNKATRTSVLSRFSFAFKTILLFFTVFSIHVVGFESITPRMISMGIIIMWFVVKKGKGNLIRAVKNWKYLAISFLLLFYSALVIWFNGVFSLSNLTVSSAFNYLLLVCFVPNFFAPLFNNSKEFCKALTISTVVQAFIVVFSFLMPSVRSFLESIQTFDFSRYNYRIVGLGIAGAGGSIYLFCGLFTNGWLLKNSGKSTPLYLLSYLVIFFAIILVGRTGFYCAVAYTVFLILLRRRNTARHLANYLKVFAVLSVGILVLIVAINELQIDFSLFNYTFGRLGELFKENNTLVRLANSSFPTLDSQTIWGIGEIRGYTKAGQLVYSDSGYTQRFLSIGYFGAIIFYASFTIYFISSIMKNIKDKRNRCLAFLLLGILLIIEYKEAFIYALAYPFVLDMLLRIEGKKTNVHGKYGV